MSSYQCTYIINDCGGSYSIIDSCPHSPDYSSGNNSFKTVPARITGQSNIESKFGESVERIILVNQNTAETDFRLERLLETQKEETELMLQSMERNTQNWIKSQKERMERNNQNMRQFMDRNNQMWMEKFSTFQQLLDGQKTAPITEVSTTRSTINPVTTGKSTQDNPPEENLITIRNESTPLEEIEINNNNNPSINIKNDVNNNPSISIRNDANNKNNEKDEDIPPEENLIIRNESIPPEEIENNNNNNNNSNNKKRVPFPDESSNAADDNGDEDDEVETDHDEEDDHDDLNELDTHNAALHSLMNETKITVSIADVASTDAISHNARSLDKSTVFNYTSLGGTKCATLGTTNLLLSYDNKLSCNMQSYTNHVYNLLMEKLIISLCLSMISIHAKSRLPPEPPPLLI